MASQMHLKTEPIMRIALCIVGLLSFWPSLTVAQEKNGEDLMAESVAALRSHRHEEAIKISTQVIEREPKNSRAYWVRAFSQLQLDEAKAALADLNTAVELNPNSADFLELRGTAKFMLGRFKDAVADFDREIELRPEREPWHWKRGLAYYYAADYDKGRRQFERYHERTDTDVENGVWRLLCMAKMKEFGLAGARKEMLKVRHDSRTGMMEAYAMFAGEKSPDDVLAAFEAGKPTEEELNQRRFYGHLYVGLYYDLIGRPEDARRHLTTAVEHQITHFMHDIARLHLEILEKKLKRQPGDEDLRESPEAKSDGPRQTRK
jgi:lipoprotein NlpI